jgi:hypothetical protein
MEIIMSVEELVQAYEHSSKKANDIRVLAERFNISEREVIYTLQQFNIKTPKIVSRGEAIEISDDNIKKVKNKIELDDDIAPAVSIIRKFEDMGWTKKEGIERAIQLSYYIETKLGLDCFKVYTKMLEYIIKNSGVKKLEQDIDSIQNGNRFEKRKSGGISENILEVFSQISEGIVSTLVDEPEAKPKAKPIKGKPLLLRVYEAYNMLTNPEKYRFDKWREKEAKERKLFDKCLKVARESL